MTDLIKKLEAMEAPCRECDAAIFRTLAGNPTDHCYEWNGKYLIDANVWPVTASIDAAMTLVPEGWRVGFEQGSWHDKAPNKSIAWVWPFESSYDPDWQLGQETQISNPDGFQGYAATPAIALCIAALRAQEASNGQTYGHNSGEDIICPDCNGKERI